ncbi:MAG: esterase-like activity of phytase family protein, partial [Paraprevotella sp.]|nr:esterase-like activity of phytase family protein [Paraprevotella sp.]
NAPAEVLPHYALKKRLVAAFSTRMSLWRPRLANYEGLCEGATLADGRRTWLLVSDSQGNYGTKWCHLRDWICVLVPPKTK